MSAPRRISASDTAFLKFFGSGVFLGFIVLFVVITAQLVAARHRSDLAGTGVVGMAVASCLMCTWIAIRVIRSEIVLMRVALSDAGLHVSNFRREVTVPLGDVEAVDEIDKQAFYRVAVRFTRDTAFGRRIIFAPIDRGRVKPHPIIAELRAGMAGAKRA